MEQQPDNSERSVASMATMEVIVAALFLAFGALVMFDSYRNGAGWGPDGPEPGYFPFYTGLIIAVMALVLIVQGLRLYARPAVPFVLSGQLAKVMSVFIPALVYVLGIELIGIYVASAVYVALFMKFIGKYTWVRSASVGGSVGLFSFFLFERWFSIPLPKGFIERALGY